MALDFLSSKRRHRKSTAIFQDSFPCLIAKGNAFSFTAFVELWEISYVIAVNFQHEDMNVCPICFNLWASSVSWDWRLATDVEWENTYQ